jgi:ligand-binding sensor domain-containing protein
MVEIYSALIFYLLTQIAISLAAEKTGESISAFSSGRSFQVARAFLLTNLSRLLDSFDGGVSRYDGETCLNFTTEDGLPSNAVWAIHRDLDGAIWFGTSNGITPEFDTF